VLDERRARAKNSTSTPPDLDVEQLMTPLAGLLGFGGMRSFEKHKGVATR
jgi:hypothetical protein